ncbi:jacalin-like lectin [Duganella sp. Root198D2]|uniref:jacalin-like lectin n=1 Tax=Duganella sp. Root198D2 TaxID=1736489 RepID=UPI00070D8220|nr:hypothetical protein [Duganella sp. Root198D2]KRB96441.1 hypothetical protein ASE26_25625 [Duganella sp. Root198D2]
MKTLTMENGVVISNYGGEGGDTFNAEFVRSLAIRSAREVDAIIINGHQHGGDGGDPSNTLVFADDEYICSMSIRSGARVDQLQFQTNKGRTLGGGGDGGDPHQLSNIRVIAIGGRSAARLDQIQITYVDDYVPSTVLQERAQFVIAFTPQNTLLKEYSDTFYRTADSYEKVTETRLSQKYSASAEAEYYAKVAVSTEIEYVNTSTSTISHELTQELKNGSYTEKTVNAGQVGVSLVNGTIMRSPDGHTWMFPTTPVSYAVIAIDAYRNVLNHYDLTGELATQMPELIKFRTEKNGYVLYQG